MAGMIVDSYSDDPKAKFCHWIFVLVRQMYEELDFILDYKVMCISIDRKYYIYVRVEVDTPKYIMHILNANDTLEDAIRRVAIPSDIGIKDYKIEIINVG